MSVEKTNAAKAAIEIINGMIVRFGSGSISQIMIELLEKAC